MTFKNVISATAFLLLSISPLHTAIVFAGIACYDCHGTKGDHDYRPLDSPFRNFSTGGFQGNHRTHMGPSANAESCAKCHPGSSAYTTGHRNGTINLSSNINNSPLTGSYRNVTSIVQTPSPELGTCSNVNCHFEKTTPAWGATTLLQAPNDCYGTCHSSPPAGGSGGADGSHYTHSIYFPGLENCTKCHPDHIQAPQFAHATSAANRGVIVKPADSLFGTMGNYTANRKDFLPSQTSKFSVCYNFYCHSTVQGTSDPTQPYQTISPPTWGQSWVGYTYSNICGGINGCHGVGFSHPDDYPGDAPYFKPLNSGSHTRHLKYRFNEVGNCEACHYNYSHAGSGCSGCHAAHSAFVNHIDHDIHMEFDTTITVGGTYSGSTTPGSPYGACSGLYCHSDGTYVATSALNHYTSIKWGSGALSCTSCHGYPPAYTTGAPKANSHQKHEGYSCNNCHYTTTANGSAITTSRYHVNKAYDVTPDTSGGVSFSYVFARSGGTCNNISCHHGGNATWGGTLPCDGCHDAPPATASHLVHYSGTAAQAGYGDVRTAQDFSPNAAGYIMNCGNCHPMDPSKHGNGKVDVELYNPSAPAGSIKAMNPSFAKYSANATVLMDSRGFAYTNGTCSNVYCHSYSDWSTPGGVPESTDCSSYLPPNLVTARVYRTVTWGGPSLGCTGCHATPPSTSYPANDGGSGDSHSWIDGYGYENLHNWDMSFHPVSCSYCHNDTVKQQNPWTRDANGVATLGPVPIANFSKHVNGRNDIAFDRTTLMNYSTSGGLVSMSLVNAGYDAGTKTCTNVSCHFNQTSVKWGTPYRWYSDIECDRCHQYSGYCR